MLGVAGPQLPLAVRAAVVRCPAGGAHEVCLLQYNVRKDSSRSPYLPTALTHVRVGCPVSELLLSRSMSRSRFSQVFLMMKGNLIQLDDILQISPADEELEPSTSHASHLTVIGIGPMSSG